MSIFEGQSPLQQDIVDISSKRLPGYSASFETEIRVHTVDKDLDYRDGVAIAKVKTYRDYARAMTDYIELEINCLLGTYLYDIYPYLDNLEVSLIQIRQAPVNGKPIVVKERYKAVFLVERNSNLPTNTSVAKTDLNQGMPVPVILQLLDRSAEALRVKTVQGSFDSRINPKNKDMSPSSFIKSLISEHADKILIENKPCLDKISVEEADNKNPLKAITIPSGTRLVELVDFIQTKSDGIYNAGVGNYVQRFGGDRKEISKCMFVYSLFNSKKYDKSEYKIILYSPPTSNQGIDDVTYQYEDKVLRIVAHAVPNIRDMKESQVMSTGGGYRTANSNSMTKKPVVIKDGGPSFKRNELVTEIVYKDRNDGINFAPAKGMSSNHFAMNSSILEKSGKTVPVRLTNVDPDFIYPGAGVKIVFEGKDGGVEEHYGVIHRAVIIMTQPAMNLTHMLSSPRLSMSCQIDLDIFIQG